MSPTVLSQATCSHQSGRRTAARSPSCRSGYAVSLADGVLNPVMRYGPAAGQAARLSQRSRRAELWQSTPEARSRECVPLRPLLEPRSVAVVAPRDTGQSRPRAAQQHSLWRLRGTRVIQLNPRPRDVLGLAGVPHVAAVPSRSISRFWSWPREATVDAYTLGALTWSARGG